MDDQVERLRARAAEAEAQADKTTDEASRAMMRKIAELYLNLADRLEELRKRSGADPN